MCNTDQWRFVGCYKITTVFSHAQSEVVCPGCFTILCMPTGGKARLTEGKKLNFSFKRKICMDMLLIRIQLFLLNRMFFSKKTALILYSLL